MTGKAWFTDEADAKRYIGEAGRVWVVWLVGLGVLSLTEGVASAVVGGALLVVMFIVMSPLQNRVHEMFAPDQDGPPDHGHEPFGPRDKVLRQLTYGREPFAEAVDKRGLASILKAAPWVVIAATLVMSAVLAIKWFGA